MFGSMLQKAGVGNDIYELCDIDLKDFSLQGMHGRYQKFRLVFIILECKITFSVVLAPFIHLEQLSGSKVSFVCSTLFGLS
jgi:hypothetical protein